MRTVPCIGSIGVIDEVIIKQCNFVKSLREPRSLIFMVSIMRPE